MNPEGPLPPNSQYPPSGVPPVSNTAWQTNATPQQNTTSYSVDYLNQIAPKEQKTVNRFAVIALIGGILVSALFAMILIANSGGPSANEQLPPIASRIDTLKTVTAAQQPHLKELKISETNAALNSSLTSMSTDMQTMLKDRKIKVSEKSTASKKEATYSENLAKTLDESYQRGTLDRIYASQMTYELTLLKSKLSKLQRSTKNEELSSFTKSAIQNINTILAAYSAFQSSDSATQ